MISNGEFGEGTEEKKAVTCRVLRATKMMGSSSDDWIY
jgi:hypothetical protein